MEQYLVDAFSRTAGRSIAGSETAIEALLASGVPDAQMQLRTPIEELVLRTSISVVVSKEVYIPQPVHRTNAESFSNKTMDMLAALGIEGLEQFQ